MAVKLVYYFWNIYLYGVAILGISLSILFGFQFEYGLRLKWAEESIAFYASWILTALLSLYIIYLIFRKKIYKALLCNLVLSLGCASLHFFTMVVWGFTHDGTLGNNWWDIPVSIMILGIFGCSIAMFFINGFMLYYLKRPITSSAS